MAGFQQRRCCCNLRRRVSTTFLECTDVTDYGIFYGDTWQMAPNLPNIKQTDLLKWVIKAFGCIAELETDNKQLRLTKFKTWLTTTSVTTGLNF